MCFFRTKPNENYTSKSHIHNFWCTRIAIMLMHFWPSYQCTSKSFRYNFSLWINLCVFFFGCFFFIAHIPCSRWPEKVLSGSPWHFEISFPQSTTAKKHYTIYGMNLMLFTSHRFCHSIGCTRCSVKFLKKIRRNVGEKNSMKHYYGRNLLHSLYGFLSTITLLVSPSFSLSQKDSTFQQDIFIFCLDWNFSAIFCSAQVSVHHSFLFFFFCVLLWNAFTDFTFIVIN